MFENSGSLQKSGDIEVMQLLYILQKELRHRSLVWKYIFMNTNIKFLSRWFFSPYFGLESYISLASVKSPPPPPATEQAPKIDDTQKEFILGIPSWLLWTYVGAHQNLLPPICRSNFHNIWGKTFSHLKFLLNEPCFSVRVRGGGGVHFWHFDSDLLSLPILELIVPFSNDGLPLLVPLAISDLAMDGPLDGLYLPVPSLDPPLLSLAFMLWILLALLILGRRRGGDDLIRSGREKERTRLVELNTYWMVGKMSSDEKKPFFPMVGIAAHSARVWSGFSLAAWSEILLLGGKTGVRRGNLCHSLIYLPGQLAFMLN